MCATRDIADIIEWYFDMPENKNEAITLLAATLLSPYRRIECKDILWLLTIRAPALSISASPLLRMRVVSSCRCRDVAWWAACHQIHLISAALARSSACHIRRWIYYPKTKWPSYRRWPYRAFIIVAAYAWQRLLFHGAPILGRALLLRLPA